MIPLDHEIWQRLSCHSITGPKFAAILAKYYAEGVPERDDLYEALLQCVCGGTVYDSSYAAAPHLIRLAGNSDALSAAILLGFAAHALASAQDEPNQVAPGLKDSLCRAATEASDVAIRTLPLLDPSLPERLDLEAALHAFSGDAKAYRAAIARV